LKLTKPYPFVFCERLSRTTWALRNDLYFWKAFANKSSVTSLPKSPQKILKSFGSHVNNESSSHVCPPADLKTVFFFGLFLFGSKGPTFDAGRTEVEVESVLVFVVVATAYAVAAGLGVIVESATITGGATTVGLTINGRAGTAVAAADG